MGISEECHDITMYKIILYTQKQTSNGTPSVPVPIKTQQFEARNCELVWVSVIQSI